MVTMGCLCKGEYTYYIWAEGRYTFIKTTSLYPVRSVNVFNLPDTFHWTMQIAFILQSLKINGEVPDKTTCFKGVFYNYFSIGKPVSFSFGSLELKLLFLKDASLSIYNV